MKKMTVRLPEDVHETLTTLSEKENVTKNEMIIKSINSYDKEDECYKKIDEYFSDVGFYNKKEFIETLIKTHRLFKNMKNNNIKVYIRYPTWKKYLFDKLFYDIKT